MSGQYDTTANTIHEDQMFTGDITEFGMRVFSNPHAQATYQHLEDEYKKKYNLKQAYDKQEFLRRMRVDTRREYLTRKKQIKHLQNDAAIDFRNAEMSLQEHYAGAQANHRRHHRAIDISAPLVSQFVIPSGETLDLKAFDASSEFAKVVDMHQNLVEDQNESYRQWCEQQAAIQSSWGKAHAEYGEWCNQSPPTSEDESGAAYQPSGAFGGCYDEEHYPDEHGDDNDNGNDSSSYDSDYCAEFGYYPREYNYEREIREAEEARLQQQNKRPSHLPGCANPRCVSCCWDDDRGYSNTWSDDESEPEEEEEILDSNNKWNLPMTEEEKMILENGEEAQRQLEESPEDLCVSGAHVTIGRAERMLELLKERAAVEEQKAMEIPDCPPTHDEPAPASASTGGGMISAKKKAAAGAAAKAAKARIVKQQKKKQQKKYVPIQVTENTNRTNEVTAILTANKLEINLPKKQLLNATREAKKRYNQKWNHTNTECKQSAARGIRIANIPVPRNPDDSDYSDSY
jgi:hypothetical protein